jgi:hypothetical protein
MKDIVIAVVTLAAIMVGCTILLARMTPAAKSAEVTLVGGSCTVIKGSGRCIRQCRRYRNGVCV